MAVPKIFLLDPNAVTKFTTGEYCFLVRLIILSLSFNYRIDLLSNPNSIIKFNLTFFFYLL